MVEKVLLGKADKCLVRFVTNWLSNKKQIYKCLVIIFYVKYRGFSKLGHCIWKACNDINVGKED